MPGFGGARLVDVCTTVLAYTMDATKEGAVKVDSRTRLFLGWEAGNFCDKLFTERVLRLMFGMVWHIVRVGQCVHE